MQVAHSFCIDVVNSCEHMESYEERDAHLHRGARRKHEQVSELSDEASEELHKRNNKWNPSAAEFFRVRIKVVNHHHALLDIANQLHVQDHRGQESCDVHRNVGRYNYEVLLIKDHRFED